HFTSHFHNWRKEGLHQGSRRREPHQIFTITTTSTPLQSSPNSTAMNCVRCSIIKYATLAGVPCLVHRVQNIQRKPEEDFRIFLDEDGEECLAYHDGNDRWYFNMYHNLVAVHMQSCICIDCRDLDHYEDQVYEDKAYRLEELERIFGVNHPRTINEA